MCGPLCEVVFVPNLMALYGCQMWVAASDHHTASEHTVTPHTQHCTLSAPQTICVSSLQHG